MNTESEFKLITDLKSIDRQDLETTTYNLINAYNVSTNLNAEASLKLKACEQVINLMAERIDNLKSTVRFLLTLTGFSTVGVVGLFLLLLAE